MLVSNAESLTMRRTPASLAAPAIARCQPTCRSLGGVSAKTASTPFMALRKAEASSKVP